MTSDVPRLLPLSFVFLAGLVTAGEVRYASTEYIQGGYRMEFDAVVAANHAAVYQIVTDYDHLDRLNSALIESTLISDAGDPVKRLRQVTKTCILFFCFSATLVEDVKEIGTGLVLTTIDPAQSDFDYGHTRWEFTAEGEDHTRIHILSRIKPSFWVPPLIGPWVVKNKMLKEVRETIDQVELLARND